LNADHGRQHILRQIGEIRQATLGDGGAASAKRHGQ
jgi:hypothetical protein